MRPARVERTPPVHAPQSTSNVTREPHGDWHVFPRRCVFPNEDGFHTYTGNPPGEEQMALQACM